MQRDIEIAKDLGANGVVIGLLTPDGEIDHTRTMALADLARPLRVTFHRAFDMVTDAHAALETLVSLGLDRILTSGLEATAMEGAQTIKNLVHQAGGRIIMMPGGGLHERNVAKIVRQTGASEVHMSGRSAQESQMRYRNPRISLGGTQQTPEYSQQITSAARIRASLDALHSVDNPT
jgi:copper homeostasis protein